MKNPIISPSEVDVFVNKVLDKNGSDFEPEIIPVIIESFSKTLNCFIDVEEKVKRELANEPNLRGKAKKGEQEDPDGRNLPGNALLDL